MGKHSAALGRASPADAHDAGWVARVSRAGKATVLGSGGVGDVEYINHGQVTRTLPGNMYPSENARCITYTCLNAPPCWDKAIQVYR